MSIIVLVMTKNVREANAITTKLLDKKLIACANIVKDIKSVFLWKGKIDRANEVLLILKSQKKCFSKIVKIVKQNHSYEVPEIIALPIVDGNTDYLKWIKESC